MKNHIRPEVCYPKTNFYSLDQFEPNTPVVGTALRFNSKSREIIVDLGDFTGIIPETEVCPEKFKYPELSNIPYQISTLIGKKVRAIVTNILDDGTIMLSRKSSLLETWNSIHEGMIVEAKIKSIVEHGIYIDIGNGFISYVNKKNCSTTRYRDIKNWFNVDDTVKVKIIAKDPLEYRFYSSRKEAYPSLSDNTSIQKGDILLVKVSLSSLLEDGYFCEYTPAISCIVDSTEILKEGQTIPARVKGIKDIGLQLHQIK